MPSNIKLFRRHNYNPVFIETGSFDGVGIKNAYFARYKEIFSVELEENHYLFCKECFKYNDNIHVLQGDSPVMLQTILSSLTVPATFWLDAHYSGEGTAETPMPLMRELDAIKQSPIKTHTILIDDLRNWKKKTVGFGLEEIQAKILEINPDYVFSFADGVEWGDILVADARKVRPINIIVFSKDRACQLELFLRSFNHLVKNADRYDIKVLYTYSTDAFKQGYDKLMGMATPNVTFVKETSFKQDMIRLIYPDNPHTVFFVDDNVFKEDFDFYDWQMDFLDWDERIACRSLRLHPNLTFCYPTQKPMKKPVFGDKNIFEWTNAEGDFGYPMSQDGHIFRTKDILPFHVELDYTGPNTLEGQLVHKRHLMGKNMICYDRSPVMNNPINKVQSVNNNVCGTITAERLNEEFLGGHIIELGMFIAFVNRSCHQEMMPVFINPPEE
jgi:hypothetical protein